MKVIPKGEEMKNKMNLIEILEFVTKKIKKNKYKIEDISMGKNIDRSLEICGEPRDIGDRIFTVKYNIFQKAKE